MLYVCRMDKDISKLIERMFELEDSIISWGATNSQSNPGAVMELRVMKKELERIKKQLEF